MRFSPLHPLGKAETWNKSSGKSCESTTSQYYHITQQLDHIDQLPHQPAKSAYRSANCTSLTNQLHLINQSSLQLKSDNSTSLTSQLYLINQPTNSTTTTSQLHHVIQPTLPHQPALSTAKISQFYHNNQQTRRLRSANFYHNSQPMYHYD